MKPAKHQFLESQEQRFRKISLVDELVRRFLVDFPENNWFDFSDPSKRKRRSALRQNPMNALIALEFMRSLATRQSN
jgi:methylmalonyl-CoA mutase